MSTGIKVSGGGHVHIAYCAFNNYDTAVEAEDIEYFSAHNNIHLKNGKPLPSSQNHQQAKFSDPTPMAELVQNKAWYLPLSHYQIDYKNFAINSRGFLMKEANSDE